MHRRRFIGAVVASGTVALAGCSGGDGDGDDGENGGDATTAPETTTEAGPANQVRAVNTSFDPIRLEVDPGATVVWNNEDSVPHTVVSTEFTDQATTWEYDKRMTASGGGGEFTFEEEGVYEYFCDIHGESSMCGAILVGDVSLDASLPCEE
ncbi:cupredoxin domain-containing protein [Halobacterium bonnevillei]|uniref:Blue (type 1) copper domain-containing protein n=1 Tax=Halobacterium bonnevillei TaxID=2692200 RepID=A0A6B0SCT7_9EURY|nr:plastocyanin/azurin family copper-binding protein [Halobacterium bonnevillei]MXR19514.1 hypothetical protein [Halobacterium bonnevillei]